jgi:hypothetical protein
MQPMVGRARELAQLRDALGTARAGQGRIVLVTGDPGIGKSRLTDEAMLLAAGDGFVVAWGRAWEAGGAPPFWPWIQVFRAIRRRDPRTELPNQVAALLAEGSGRAAAPLSGDADRFLLFDGVMRFLQEASARAPLAIALEDLHAADLASLHLLEFVASSVADAAVALVGTFRDVEARADPARRDPLARIARPAVNIALAPLGEDDLQTWVKDELAPSDRATLHRASEGNPLFIREMLELLRAGGAPGALPPSVRLVIEERLGRLPPDLLSILETAAAIGREVSATLLAEVSGVPLDALMAHLTGAVAAGVLVEPTPSRFTFTHGLIRDTLRGRVATPRRFELHRRIADGLERLHSGDPAPPDGEIAHHRFAAGPDQAFRAVEVARRAAETAARKLAFEEAAALLERASAALAAAAPGDGADRCSLEVALGEAQLRSGEVERGRATCRAAAEMARAIGSLELEGRAALAYGSVSTFARVDPVMVELLRGALDRAPPDHPVRARLLARLASAMQPADDPRGPIEIAREAVAAGRRIADPSMRMWVLFSAMGALGDYAPPGERRSINEEVLRLAVEVGEPAVELRSRLRLVFDHFDEANREGALQQAEEYESLALRFPQPHVHWQIDAVRSVFAAVAGDFHESERRLAAARAIVERIGDRGAAFLLGGHELFLLRISERNRELARRRADLVRWLPPGLKHYHDLTLAMALARAGEQEESRRALAGIDLASGARSMDSMYGAWLADVVVVTGDQRAAAVLDEVAASVHERICTAMPPFTVEGPVARLKMVAQATLGKPDAARASYEAARTIATSWRARPWLMRIELDWAALRKGSAEGEAARTRGLALAEELGIEELTASVSTPPADRVRLEREGEGWRVALGEASCRVKDSRGVQMLARLVATPDEEVHVFELAGVREPVDAGDAGEVIDEQARAEYRARLEALRAELDEAEGWNDVARAARSRREIEALETELARGTGLGGRLRRASGALERARVNVQKRLSDAIRRVAEQSPPVGAHLDQRVRTGAYCCYASRSRS